MMDDTFSDLCSENYGGQEGLGNLEHKILRRIVNKIKAIKRMKALKAKNKWIYKFININPLNRNHDLKEKKFSQSCRFRQYDQLNKALKEIQLIDKVD